MNGIVALSPETYPRYRHQIKSGDVFAWTGTGILSEMVRHWVGSSYSHVGIAWVIGGRVLILEAMPKSGVCIRPISGQLNKTCYWIKTGVDWTHDAEAMALSQIGQRYSYISDLLVGAGLRPIHHGWECAQYVIAVLKACGLDLDCDATPGAVVTALLHQA